MTRQTRIILAIVAGLGWGKALAIFVASLHLDAVAENEFFFGGIAGLLGLAAAVLTLGLWLDRPRQAVETAQEIGIQAGIRMGRLMAAEPERNAPENAFSGYILNYGGQSARWAGLSSPLTKRQPFHKR